MLSKEQHDQMLEWLAKVFNCDKERVELYVKTERDNAGNIFSLYTKDYTFKIYCNNSHMHGYAHCNYCEPGETWHRGSDLPDGKFSEKTFSTILNAIFRYQFLKRNPSTAEGTATGLLLEDKVTNDMYWTKEYSIFGGTLDALANGAGRIRTVVDIKTNQEFNFEPTRLTGTDNFAFGQSICELDPRNLYIYTGNAIIERLKQMPLRELNMLLFSPLEDIRQLAKDCISR